MDEERMKQLRAEVRADRQQQGLPEEIEAADGVDAVTAVLLLSERERRLGIVRPHDY